MEATYPNQTKVVFTYDASNQVTNIANIKDNGTIIRNYAYTYDPNGRRKSMIIDELENINYEYDDLGQLILQGSSEKLVKFRYDEIGNRIQMLVDNTSIIDYTYDAANQLLTAGLVSYAYDANGNRVRKTTVTEDVYYSYDFNNALIGISTNKGSTQYIYDGDGRKVARITDQGQTHYLLDGNVTLLESNVVNMSNPSAFIEGPSGILAKFTPEDIIQFYYYDTQGNLGAITDTQGEIINSYQYDAWGQVVEQTGSGVQEIGYVGMHGVTHEEDSLLLMGARFYDSETGVFLQKDPFPGILTDPTTLHPYMYTRNDPVNKIDPEGTFWGWNDLKQQVNSLASSGKRMVNQAVDKVSDASEAVKVSVKRSTANLVRAGRNLRGSVERAITSKVTRVKRGIATGSAKLKRTADRTIQRAQGLARSGVRFAVDAGNAVRQAVNSDTGRYMARQGTSVGISLIPGIGDVKDAQEALTGYDIVTQQRLSGGDRVLAGVAMVIPVVNGKLLRGIFNAAEHADEIRDSVKVISEASDTRRVFEGVTQANKPVYKYWDNTVQFNGNKVYQRRDLFDPNTISSWKVKGKTVTGTNVERMASGRAPIGYDGKTINLHHLTQTQSGALAEVSQSFHQKNYSTIHINTGELPSGINRGAFDTWRVDYWINRANDFL